MNEAVDFKSELEKNKLEVQECQKSAGVSSCLQCDKAVECSVRKGYVESVYNFLNGGEQNGGFDF